MTHVQTRPRPLTLQPHARGMLRPTQVRQHVRYLCARGYAEDEVLEGTGIDPARLEDSDCLVEAWQSHQVVSNVLQLTGDGGIGLKIGQATRINDLGIVGYAMASANTLGAAIGLWLQYGNSPVGFPFNPRLLDPAPSDGWGISVAATGFSGALYRFYVEEIIAMGMSFGRRLTGEPFEIVSAEFSYPAPRHARLYSNRLKCTVRFDAPLTKIVVRTPDLRAPVRSNDSELRELCIRHCRQLVRQIAQHGPVGARLRSTLTTLGSIPTLDEAAEALNMSARTLRRQLAAEGTSFQQVLDAFRDDLAREYLGSGMMAPKEVAYLLGYRQVETFRRAFKEWTGMTISEFVRQTRVPSSASGPIHPENKNAF